MYETPDLNTVPQLCCDVNFSEVVDTPSLSVHPFVKCGLQVLRTIFSSKTTPERDFQIDAEYKEQPFNFWLSALVDLKVATIFRDIYIKKMSAGDHFDG